MNVAGAVRAELRAAAIAVLEQRHDAPCEGPNYLPAKGRWVLRGVQ